MEKFLLSLKFLSACTAQSITPAMALGQKKVLCVATAKFCLLGECTATAALILFPMQLLIFHAGN